MKQKMRPVRGMHDVAGEGYQLHDDTVRSAEFIAKLYGYKGMLLPILEHIEVFNRTLGEGSDVIAKEMYSFNDRSENGLALRPEFTAGTMRAFISNGWQQQLPLKLFTTGPVFRYDRPQAGRQRQFYQLNFEYIGASSPYDDAELISMASHLLQKLAISDKAQVELNSIGSSESRKAYQAALLEYFGRYEAELSDDSKMRLAKNNPMRILDSKDQSDQKLCAGAPIISSYFNQEDENFFQQVQQHLVDLGIKYNINERLVRGLDYYSHTVFEFTTTALGAQNTILAGGRYDGLCELMGGKQVPAIGFAAGIERLNLLRQESFSAHLPASCFVLPVNQAEKEQKMAIELTDSLRKTNIPTNYLASGKMQKRLQKAIASGAKYVVFIGEEEVKTGTYTLKDIDNEQQSTCSLTELFARIAL